MEPDLGAGLFARPDHLEVAGRNAALVPLSPHLRIALDLDLEPIRKRVDDGHADAVQAAGHFVCVLVELSARVQARQHDFRGRALLDRMLVDRDAAAVVHHRDRLVIVDRDGDLTTEAGQSLVDRVVDDFVDEMVQTLGTGGPDVHRRPLADGFEAFEDLD